MSFGFPKAFTIDQINGGPFLVQMVGTAVLGANAVSTHVANPTSLPFKIRSDDFLWTHAVAISTSTFRHRLYSDWEGRYLDNDFVRSELFWGTSFFSALQIPPKWLPLDGQIRFDLEDTSNAPNTVEIYLVGMKANSCGKPQDTKCDGSCGGLCNRARYGRGRGLVVLSTPSLTGIIAQSNSTADGTLIMEDPWNMRVIYKHGISRRNSNNLGFKVNVELIDPREGERQWISNALCTGAAILGQAAAPALLPSPMLALRGSEVTALIQDTLATGATHAVDISLIGERVDDELLKAE